MATITTQYKKIQGDVLDSAHKLLLAGLGTAKTLGEESGEIFDRMVARGREVETKGKKELDSRKKEIHRLTEKVESRVEGVGNQLDKQLSAALARLGVPSRTEIQTLTRRVEELTRKVDVLAATPVAAPAKAVAVYHVAPHEEGWKVGIEGQKAPASVHPTKEAALNAAREIAKAAEPSRVVVHRMDGTIQNQFGYGDDVN